MAVARSSITSGSSTSNNATFDTASVTLTAGRLYLVAVVNSDTAPETAPSGVATVGGAVTFVKVAEQVFDTAASPIHVLSVWRAIPASTVTAAIRITLPDAGTGCAWAVEEFTGIYGTTPIQQAVVAVGAAVASLGVTMEALASPGNMFIAFSAHDLNSTSDTAAASGWTDIGTGVGYTTPNTSLDWAESTSDTSVSFTGAGSADRAVIGIEINEPGPTPVAPTSYFDHHTTLDTAKHTKQELGTGTVTATDSTLAIAGGTAGNTAIIHTADKIDITKSQKWLWAVRRSAGGTANHFAYIQSSVHAPKPRTNTLWQANTVARLALSTISTVVGPDLNYFDFAGVRQIWNGSAWQTTNAHPFSPCIDDDCMTMGIQIDGTDAPEFTASGGFRLFWLGHGLTGSTFAYGQGMQLHALTAWVPWSSARTSSDLWLVRGWAVTDFAMSATLSVEWTRCIVGT